MQTLRNLVFIIFSFGGITGLAFADTPPNLTQPDTHSVESKGHVTLYRAQVQGLEFGRGEERVDAEVLVTLDSQPDLVFTLPVHDTTPPMNKIIAETLRDAYISKTPVTIYHQIAPGRKNVKIHMVQLSSN
jgi:hypothetical protein